MCIRDRYELVADKNPMQIVALEKALLDESFEGVFLPKILGFSVLRPEIDNQYKYKRPQERFKEILLTICNSANFESIKQRIGQTVQIGFALSSSIWLTTVSYTHLRAHETVLDLVCRLLLEKKKNKYKKKKKTILQKKKQII